MRCCAPPPPCRSTGWRRAGAGGSCVVMWVLCVAPPPPCRSTEWRRAGARGNVCDGIDWAGFPLRRWRFIIGCPRNKDLSYELEAVQGHTPHLHPTTSPTRPTSAATTAPTPGHRLSIPPSGSSGDTAVRMQTAMDGADGAEPSGDAGGGPRTAEHISCAVSLSAAEMSIAKATAGRARTGTASSCQRRLFGAVSCIRRLHLNGMRQS